MEWSHGLIGGSSPCSRHRTEKYPLKNKLYRPLRSLRPTVFRTFTRRRENPSKKQMFALPPVRSEALGRPACNAALRGPTMAWLCESPTLCTSQPTAGCNKCRPAPPMAAEHSIADYGETTRFCGTIKTSRSMQTTLISINFHQFSRCANPTRTVSLRCCAAGEKPVTQIRNMGAK